MTNRIHLLEAILAILAILVLIHMLEEGEINIGNSRVSLLYPYFEGEKGKKFNSRSNQFFGTEFFFHWLRLGSFDIRLRDVIK